MAEVWINPSCSLAAFKEPFKEPFKKPFEQPFGEPFEEPSNEPFKKKPSKEHFKEPYKNNLRAAACKALQDQPEDHAEAGNST